MQSLFPMITLQIFEDNNYIPTQSSILQKNSSSSMCQITRSNPLYLNVFFKRRHPKVNTEMQISLCKCSPRSHQLLSGTCFLLLIPINLLKLLSASHQFCGEVCVCVYIYRSVWGMLGANTSIRFHFSPSQSVFWFSLLSYLTKLSQFHANFITLRAWADRP